MAALKDQLTNEMKAAMKARDKERLGIIRLILSECKRIEVDERIELSDERVISILDKMTKQRRDSIKQYEAAERQGLADQEAYEITVIKEFLPEALTEEDLAKLLEKAIEDSGASSIKDMGKVMAVLKPQIQGRADVGAVSKLVKEALG
ncbi:MAG: GatB/YqeY domain-containing protein [Cellvibrionaceae bacterium]